MIWWRRYRKRKSGLRWSDGAESGARRGFGPRHQCADTNWGVGHDDHDDCDCDHDDHDHDLDDHDHDVGDDLDVHWCRFDAKGALSSPGR